MESSCAVRHLVEVGRSSHYLEWMPEKESSSFRSRSLSNYKIRNIRTGERAEFTQAGTRYISGIGPNGFLNLFKRNKTIMLGEYEIELVELREKKISITVERAKEKIKELKEEISELEAFIQEKKSVV